MEFAEDVEAIAIAELHVEDHKRVPAAERACQAALSIGDDVDRKALGFER